MDDERISRGYHHMWGRGRGKRGLALPELQRVQQAPEWKAAHGLITAEEYLATFGDHRGPVEILEHGQSGHHRLWKKKRSK